MKKRRGVARSLREPSNPEGEALSAPTDSPDTASPLPSTATPPDPVVPATQPGPPSAGRLYTQCPACKTVYRITVAQLRRGRGLAHCQECQADFEVLGTLAETAAGAGIGVAQVGHAPLLGRLDAVAGPTGDRLSPLGDSDVRDAEKNRFSLAWGMGALFLSAALALQVGMFEGPRWAQDEGLRPWLDAACQSLGCRLPDFHAPRLIRVIDHGLEPVADGGEGYEFTLVFANQAPVPQPFPGIKLVLAAHNGSPAATRVFQPAEYLPQPGPALMAVGAPYEVRLSLSKPSREIGGFSFDLM